MFLNSLTSVSKVYEQTFEVRLWKSTCCTTRRFTNRVTLCYYHVLPSPLDAPDALDLRRYHHARADREEAHVVQGDSLPAAPSPAETSGEAASSGQERRATPGAEPVQAGQCLRSAWLGKRQRREKDPPASLPDTDHCVLGYGHLTLKTCSFPALQLLFTHPLILLCCADALCFIRGIRTANQQQGDDTR